MNRPPAAPGTAPAVYRLFPIEDATVKSPAVVSCHTPVAMAAAVSWFVTVVTVVIVPAVMFVVLARVAPVGKVIVPAFTTGFVLIVSTSTFCVVAIVVADASVAITRAVICSDADTDRPVKVELVGPMIALAEEDAETLAPPVVPLEPEPAAAHSGASAEVEVRRPKSGEVSVQDAVRLVEESLSVFREALKAAEGPKPLDPKPKSGVRKRFAK